MYDLNPMHSKLRIFTWHIHGSYLYYLSQGNYEIYIPVLSEKREGYGGRGSFPFGDNVIEVHAADVKHLTFDCILFQSAKNYVEDQHRILSPEQRTLPKIYLEHDPPRQTPTDTKHVVDDPEITIVHVTHFNNMMWDNNQSPSLVIEHGVVMPKPNYSGELEKGIVVINNLKKRGRRLGLDIYLEVKKHIPIDLVGMGSDELDGLGEIHLSQLPEFISRYRFFFNPIRYTSFGLSVCEAMMLGMPIVAMATTEMPTVINNGVSGYIHTDVSFLISRMKALLENRNLAAQLGEGAKQVALERFNIERFTQEWEQLFYNVVHKKEKRKFSSYLKV